MLPGRGGPYTGIEHLWRDHKERFVDPELAIRLLRETLGNPKCRVVVSLKRAVARVREKKAPICLKRIVLHNPAAKTYCVMIYDGRELKLVSWNNAGGDYGLNEWTLEQNKTGCSAGTLNREVPHTLRKPASENTLSRKNGNSRKIQKKEDVGRVLAVFTAPRLP